MAPTHGDLWLSISLDGGLGLVGLAAAWLMPRSQREFNVEFASLPLRERLRWRHQRRNLLYSGWFLLLMFGLIGWCWFSGVFVEPALLAGNAVFFAALPPWAIPRAAPDQQRRAEQSAAPDPARISSPGSS